jgi:GT2 family glycosyltransferase
MAFFLFFKKITFSKKDNPLINIIILTWNKPEITLLTLSELSRQNLYNCNLIIIDNGSRSEEKSKYTTYETGENCYFGGALNLAMDLFKSNEQYDSFLSLNNDIILPLLFLGSPF